ncbi:MAG: FMN-binding protein [Bryobacterales bacterium]
MIVSVYQATKPVIARNRADAGGAIFVLPGAKKSSQAFRLVDGDRFEAVEGQAAPGDALVYAGYDASGSLAGFAIEGAAGYQDTIRLLWGYDPTAQTVIGFHVLESKETPGLGDKITSDEGFLENFRALDVRLDAAGAKLANAVVAVKHGQKAQAWQVDGITGATISSVAVSGILDQSAAFWLPKIQKDLTVFEHDKTAVKP